MGRGGHHVMIFFHKIPFFLTDGFPYCAHAHLQKCVCSDELWHTTSPPIPPLNADQGWHQVCVHCTAREQSENFNTQSVVQSAECKVQSHSNILLKCKVQSSGDMAISVCASLYTCVFRRAVSIY